MKRHSQYSERSNEGEAPSAQVRPQYWVWHIVGTPERGSESSHSSGADRQPSQGADRQASQKAVWIETHLQTQPNEFITAVENDFWIHFKTILVQLPIYNSIEALM